MAFNPFHSFRKHQKVFLAAVTIMAMVTFIFTGFAGDPIQRGLQAIANMRGRGPLLATVSGEKLYEFDLEKLARQRQAASDFLVIVASISERDALQEARKKIQAAKSEDGFDKTIRDAVRNWEERNFRQQRMAADAAEQIRNDLRDLQRLAVQREHKPELAALAESLVGALKFEYWKLNPDRPAGTYFFGGSRKPEELIDFVVWRKQADKLGIVLTPEDLRKAINLETGRREVLTGTQPFDKDPRFQEFFTKNRDVREPALVSSLNDELRVLLTQEALLGEPAANRGPLDIPDVVNQPPASFSPLEYLQFFRKERTTLKVGMLAVPVTSFEGQVKGTPSETDLDRLYERYKDVEQSPERDRPGFKEPRRIRAEYVTVDSSSPHFKAAALSRLIQPTLARIGCFANAYPAGGGLAWGMVAATAMTGDDALQHEYERFKSRYPSWMPPKTSGDFLLHDESYLQPELAPALVGQVAAALGSSGFLPAAPAAYIGPAFPHEIAQRVKVLPYWLLAGAQANSAPLSAPTLAFSATPKVPSLEQVKEELVGRTLKDLEPQMAKDALLKLLGQIYWNGWDNADEGKKIVEETKKKPGFKFYTMPDPRDSLSVLNDPGMKVLTDAANAVGPSGLSLAPSLFATTGTFQPMLFSGNSGVTPLPSPRLVMQQLAPLYPNLTSEQKQEVLQGIVRQGAVLWEFSREPFLVWRAEDKPSRVRPLDAIRPEVVAAWKRMEAQRLARQKARDIAQKIKDGAKTGDDALRYLLEEKMGEVVELDKVAIMVSSNRAGQYQKYVPPSYAIQYPRDNFVEQLMTMTKPGDSTSFHDRPEANYFVAVLLARSEPKVDSEFLETYERIPFQNSMLPQMLLAERRRQFRARVIEQMRIDTGATTDPSGKYNLPDNLNLKKAVDTSDDV